MSKSTRTLRRSGVATVAAAFAVGTVFAGAPANAVAGPDDVTIAPVKGSIANTQEVELGTVTISEDENNDIFDQSEEFQTVTLTLAGNGVTFSPFDNDEFKPTVNVPSGYTVRLEQDGDQRITRDSATQISFQVKAPTAASRANITVTGLTVDVASNASGEATVAVAVNGTQAGGPADTALKVLDNDRVARIGGQDRYETAAKLFDAATGGNIDNAVLAGGGDFPDALSANYLAGNLDSATLLTGANSLAPEAFERIISHNVKKVFITGGNTAVSKAIEDKLRATRVGDRTNAPFIQVTRLGGTDRYETNKKINQYTQTGFPARSQRALVASGAGFADAVAFGPVAYSDNAPLILVPGSSLGASASDQLDEFGPRQVLIAGGTTSVATSVADEIDDKTSVNRVRRYAGADRTGTAAEIAKLVTGTGDELGGFDFDEDQPLLANGSGFADALAGGPFAAQQGSPILLTKSSTSLGDGLSAYLGSRTINEISGFTVLGLSTVTPKALVDAALDAIGAQTTASNPNA